jgi:transcriptional regulator of acetoin/glycerol metabolism
LNGWGNRGTLLVYTVGWLGLEYKQLSRAEARRFGKVWADVESRTIPMATAAQQRIDPRARELSHADRVELSVNNENSPSQFEEISDSWRRCLVDHHVDAKSCSKPNVITQSELSISREPLAKILVQAQDEIDRLYAIVRQQAYVVLLCNRDGIAIHHRGDETRAEEFKRWGIWLGGVWSERVEGTNGIGTCIADQRPVLVHCSQHYRSLHAQLSCAGAPIFDPQGRLVAVLDVSRVNGEAENQPFPLVLDATIVSARAIGERIFRDHFRHEWTIAAAPADDTGSGLLLAVDEHQRILGADRIARNIFALSDKSLADGVPLATIFEYESCLFRSNDKQDIPVHLLRAGGDGRRWCVLITPPLSKSRVRRSGADVAVHSRPRISTLGRLPVAEPPVVKRGGLPPGLTRRICDYIESHFDQKIRLDSLAAMAGLSRDHFARAFHQSVGEPPHSYLLRRRLDHVEQLLRETQLPLSQIALATGFSDQSHLARHFRRQTGMSPSLARWRW